MNEKKGNDTISLAPITSDIPATINKENKASIPTPTPISLCTVDPCRALAIADPCLRERGVATSILLGTAQCNALDSLDTVLAGIGDVTSSIEGVTCLTIRSRYDDSVRFTIQPLVVNRITNALPTANIDHTRLDYLNDLPLADFKYYKPANIDLILGSDLFARILRHKTVSRGTTEPVAVETLLGYLVLGEAPVINSAIGNTCRSFCAYEQIETRLNKFFELEEVPDVSLLTPEENECELIYSSTVKRESSGRYVTVIPFKGDPNTLGDSLQSATRSYPSEDEAIEVSNQLIKLFKAGGFELVKFSRFADASEKAYGGVVYIHVYNPEDNKHQTSLLCAKSKVAPLRIVTLARLELCAILILSKLLRTVIDTYSERHKIDNVFAFSDSTVALAWIHSSPSRWQTFVANRVTKIHENILPNNFYHISGKLNPADCLSRGLMPKELLNHTLWFNGPHFAHKPINEWPVMRFNPTSVSEPPEIKHKVLTTTTETPVLHIFYSLALRLSSWYKLLRIIILVLRFAKILPREFNILHFEIAELAAIKALQAISFAKDLKRIRTGKVVSPALQRLNVFLHNDVLRVGGRLANADMPFDSRHPILLPRRDHIVDLIIDYYHRKYLHTGPQLLLSLIRQRYWILSARNIIRQRVRKCNICFRTNPKPEFPLMADLPSYRVREAKAFCHTGIDYAGPLYIIPYRRRGVHKIKAYVCLFVCLVTKAVHIELASDLSTEAFLNALKRFLSRRGPVGRVPTYSSNSSKMAKTGKPIQKGTVVVLKSDNSAPLDWPLGVIDDVHPGKDGVVRVVDVRTASGVYRRPVVKLCPLPNQ
ncbi:hypothetical protein EVAR_72628_1 [Eumeta japonica]|uniref:Uncharacterized protein n=1 Tax=Eumeta variegata TaxID=151549 RepID=A0A4C2AEB4_EUMVA|nr:hypothetical protein EVAR_72628_1 [Eumeta japonica]